MSFLHRDYLTEDHRYQRGVDLLGASHPQSSKPWLQLTHEPVVDWKSIGIISGAEEIGSLLERPI
jgi:hypothetical protein